MTIETIIGVAVSTLFGAVLLYYVKEKFSAWRADMTDRRTHRPGQSSNDHWYGRHTIRHNDDGQADAYMTRYWLWRFRLHVFHRGDEDPDCHDHPFSFWTFPLKGYWEEVMIPHGDSFYREDRYVRAFRPHYRPATHKHRVLGPTADTTGRFDKPVITLVYHTPRERKWGFWHQDPTSRYCFRGWREYVAEGGTHAPCAEASPHDD